MIRSTIFVLMAGLLAAGCSTVESKPRPPSMDTLLAGLTEQNGRACIRRTDIRGFAVLNDQLLSVSGRRKEHFLVTLPYSCNSLDISFQLAFTGTFSDVCGGGARDQIITREESCPIRHIYSFKSRDEAFATLELARKKREALALPPFEGK